VGLPYRSDTIISALERRRGERIVAKKIAATLAAVLGIVFPVTLSVAAGAQEETSTTPTAPAFQYDNSETANITDSAACQTVDVDTIDSETAALRGMFSVGEEGEEVYYTAGCEPAYLEDASQFTGEEGYAWDRLGRAVDPTEEAENIYWRGTEPDGSDATPTWGLEAPADTEEHGWWDWLLEGSPQY
jgi:hypothetical protein